MCCAIQKPSLRLCILRTLPPSRNGPQMAQHILQKPSKCLRILGTVAPSTNHSQIAQTQSIGTLKTLAHSKDPCAVLRKQRIRNPVVIIKKIAYGSQIAQHNLEALKAHAHLLFASHSLLITRIGKTLLNWGNTEITFDLGHIQNSIRNSVTPPCYTDVIPDAIYKKRSFLILILLSTHFFLLFYVLCFLFIFYL